MTVYIDNAYVEGKWCHLVADEDELTEEQGFKTWEEELHAFADSIGMKRKWYQEDHYDCIGSMIVKALAAGAVLLDIKSKHEDMVFLAQLSKKHRREKKEVVDKIA